MSLLRATKEVLVPTKTMPLKAAMYVWTPVMLAVQSLSGLSGAGPAEKRLNDDSPMNCGHSYPSRLELDVAEVTSCPAATLLFERILKTVANDETSNNVKMKVTFILLCVDSLPPRMIV